ncbi:MAG: GntR family transcriptional regulator [Euzebyales bacterium]|nr:GntR family transcriptional regulator [Euzebyales bacterium]MBA3621281.1 GntR family transcriptional regulator [Euzebyales bacterium]
MASPASGVRPEGHKHEQVRAHLEELLDGLAADAPLPSERELAQRLGVARMTVRQAMDRLVRTGQVYRVQGSGSFRAQERFEQPLVLTSFSEDMRARGLQPGARTLMQGLGPAPTWVARRLGLAAGAEVVRLERLRTANGEPMALERCFVDAARAPGLADEDLSGRSLYATLRERYGIALGLAEQTVQATVCDASEAALLGVEEGAAGLEFERTSSDSQGRLVEHVRSTYRGDRYRLRMTLTLP